MHERDHDVPREPYFDATLDAWVISRHADVSGALRDPVMVMPGTGAQHDPAHGTVRTSLARAWTPERMAAWRAGIDAEAMRRVAALPVGERVDLMRAFAEPWSLELARLATGVPHATALACAGLARDLFVAAATATDGAHTDGRNAALELAQHLASSSTLGDASAAVQAFVALSQTLPALLADAWTMLLADDALQATLRAHARAGLQLPPAVLGELLRTGGPARAVFRDVLADTDVGDTHLHAGDRVALMLRSANHDPERFGEPTRIDGAREGAGHLAFGAGVHACAGASMVRMALDVATSALLRGTSSIRREAAAPVEWVGGFAIRTPGTLPVVVSRSPGPEPME